MEPNFENFQAVRRGQTLAHDVKGPIKAVETGERTFRMVDRPVAGITLEKIAQGIKKFRAEYTGHLAIQIMLMRIHRKQAEAFARLLNEIHPDEVQLNAALRPIRGDSYLKREATTHRPQRRLSGQKR